MVAIVGRPNTGKSSLFNALAGRRISIVDDTPGVTRDRIIAPISHGDRAFEIVDTGGIGIVDSEDLAAHVEAQIELAIDRADVIVFLVDAKEGLTPLDSLVAERLRKAGRRTLLAANKVDVKSQGWNVGDFFALGFPEVLPVSAVERRGFDELLDGIVAALPPAASGGAEPAADVPRIAFVGQRNTGKSTLLNRLLGEERVIVSPVPGTTRDAIDVRVRRGDREFIAIDTAGMRKKSSLTDPVEFYSQVRSAQAIRAADVVILLLDATREISQVDKKIADAIVAAGRPCILAVNKWDLAGHIDTAAWARYLEARLPWLGFAPVVFLSAKDGERIDDLIDVALDLYRQRDAVAPTPDLNRAIEMARTRRSPKPRGGRVGRIYYATQVASAPPTIALFVNDPSLFDAAYTRYLENALRRTFPFGEIPIRIVYKAKPGRD